MDRIQRPGIDPQKYCQLISHKGAKAIQWRKKTAFSRNDVEIKNTHKRKLTYA